jgi:hypothetical protein
LLFVEGETNTLNPHFRPQAKALRAFLSLACAFVVLAGCQSGHKVVARVNNQAINENEFFTRTVEEHTNPYPSLEIGGAVLINLIREQLIHQLAARKNAVPSEEDVQALIAFQKRINPEIVNQINSGAVSEQSLEREVRLSMEQMGIGTEGAKADENDIKTKYEELTKAAPGQKPRLVFPELWTIRVLPFRDPIQAQRGLELLRAKKSFPAVMQEVMNVPAPLAQEAGKETVVAVPQVQQSTPALYTALKSLEPGQFVAQPVSLTMTNPQTQMPQTSYLVAQMVKKEKEAIPTLQQARPVIQQIVITERRREWQQHGDQELAAFTASSAPYIQINIERYKPLLTRYILPQAAIHSAAAAGSPVIAPPPGASPTPPASGPGGSAAPAPQTPIPAPGGVSKP